MKALSYILKHKKNNKISKKDALTNYGNFIVTTNINLIKFKIRRKSDSVYISACTIFIQGDSYLYITTFLDIIIYFFF